MTAFDVAIQHIRKVEGGYVDHPDDPGGETKYGISKRSYPDLDIKNLTWEDAVEIYRRDFWEPVAEAVGDPAMRVMVFDAAVNHGRGRALRWAQEHPTMSGYVAHRLRFYAKLGTFPTFGRGWIRRVASVLDLVAKIEDGVKVVDAVVLNHSRWQRLLDALRGPVIDRPQRYRVRPRLVGGGTKMDLSDADRGKVDA